MLRTYDPGKIVIIFKGITVQAPADGTFVSAERDNDSFTKSYGARGDAVRVRVRKMGGKVTITLMGISPTNDQFSTLLALDEETGAGVGALQIEDLNGTTLVHATNAWLVRPANYQGAAEATDREWTIDCEKLDTYVGGNLILV